MGKEIVWAPREDWDYATYSLNTRLYQMAGNQGIVDGLTQECREKFGQEPDLRPRFDDGLYFRNAGLRKSRSA
jgi:hypothetical protein